MNTFEKFFADCKLELKPLRQEREKAKIEYRKNVPWEVREDDIECLTEKEKAATFRFETAKKNVAEKRYALIEQCERNFSGEDVVFFLKHI